MNKPFMEKDVAAALSLYSILTSMPEIVITPEVVMGQNQNMVEAAAYANSVNCFHGSYFNQSKFCAYCFWPRQSEYIFGSVESFSSKFCLKCYNSLNLTRCFEVSDSTNCSDCYFCYNCEGLSNCMFCFNTKSKRYAIANVEVGKEEFERIKTIVLAALAEKIQKENGLDLDIYTIN